jgi:cytochrome c556
MKYIYKALLLSLLIFTTSVSAEDKRIAVDLSEKDREAFLTEMRVVLESIHDIVTALDKNDMNAVAAAASQSKSRIKKITEGLSKTLPSNFKVFSKSVQKGFTQIEESTQSDAGKDKVISLLGAQLGRCVTCHSIYKLK